MTAEMILARKEEVIRQFGPWTAHNVHLGGGVYTIDEKAPGQAEMLQRLIQLVHDVPHRPVRELRILDLACLEGLYGIELALQGASVVGVEGREANIEKARFAKQILELGNLELVQDDVRNISVERYGTFDVIICAGILYHLDAPDVFQFIERIFEMTTDCAIFETHVGVTARECERYKNRKYSGWSFTEHAAASSAAEKAKHAWASLDNIRSFWPTKPSLLNFLAHTGFTLVTECLNPSVVHGTADRVTLVAMKGERRKLLSWPALNAQAEEDWPEEASQRLHPAQQRAWHKSLRTAAARLLPESTKGLLRRLSGRT